jgi:hypothetical protein
MVTEIEIIFPALQGGKYKVTSPSSRDDNCTAWAAGDNSRWWWPDPDPQSEAVYWPEGVDRLETLAAFVAAFATLGYAPCPGETVEPGFDEVALFANASGVPTHAARQLTTGLWTSKLGMLEDIEHALYDISGALYGTPVVFLTRATSNP